MLSSTFVVAFVEVANALHVGCNAGFKGLTTFRTDPAIQQRSARMQSLGTRSAAHSQAGAVR